MSRAKAEQIGLKPMVKFIAFAVGGVPPELMGIGPTVAVPKVLDLAGMELSDIGLIELNEAFAAQGIAVMRELGMDPEITNVNGGAIALGHPLGRAHDRDVQLRVLQDSLGLLEMDLEPGSVVIKSY